MLVSYQKFEHAQQFYFWELTLQTYLRRYTGKGPDYQGVVQTRSVASTGKRPIGRGTRGADLCAPAKHGFQGALRSGGKLWNPKGPRTTVGRGGRWLPPGWTATGPTFRLPMVSACIASALALLFKGKKTSGSASGLVRGREKKNVSCPPAPYLGDQDSGLPRQSAPRPPDPVLTSSRARGGWPASGQESDSRRTASLPPTEARQTGTGRSHGDL